jgi:hypothetical protein
MQSIAARALEGRPAGCCASRSRRRFFLDLDADLSCLRPLFLLSLPPLPSLGTSPWQQRVSDDAAFAEMPTVRQLYRGNAAPGRRRRPVECPTLCFPMDGRLVLSRRQQRHSPAGKHAPRSKAESRSGAFGLIHRLLEAQSQGLIVPPHQPALQSTAGPSLSRSFSTYLRSAQAQVRQARTTPLEQAVGSAG